MTQHDLQACLLDILRAGERIISATVERSFDEYRANWLLRAAVERQFEIIGEALARAKRIDPELVDRIADSDKIIAFRNQVIHGYDSVDHEIVWGIIERYLPPLLEQTKVIYDSV